MDLAYSALGGLHLESRNWRIHTLIIDHSTPILMRVYRSDPWLWSLFSRDMFAHINKKGMEVVVHFLFSRLNSHLAYEEFR